MTPPPALPGDRCTEGWWCRHWRWAMPLSVLLAVLSLAAAVGVALWMWSHGSRSSAPYQEAMRRARCSVELVAELGEPIQDGYLPAGSMYRDTQGSTSQFEVALSGPQGEARMFLEARRGAEGRWDYPVLYVLTEQPEAIDLTALDDAEAATVCALQECRANGDCLGPALPGLEV